jgi:hypothetical protein
VKEYLATLNDTAFGAATEVVPKFVSPSDPAAQREPRRALVSSLNGSPRIPPTDRRRCCAYPEVPVQRFPNCPRRLQPEPTSDNYLIDVRFGVIVDVEASRSRSSGGAPPRRTLAISHRRGSSRRNCVWSCDTFAGIGRGTIVNH